MKYFLFLSICLLLSVILFSQPIIKTNAGPVSGAITTDQSIYIFKGVPFAAPPIGNLRWKAPQPVSHWQAVKACTAFAASPMQNKPAPFMMYTAPYLIPPQPISEDCLYLNIWAPSTIKKKKPVLVWIYGGGFTSGGTACAIYDGENMARKGVVFVSIPYRVGVFGFLAHPQLSKESNGKASGNYALLDQVAALQWVQKNIASFGGDPNNVTIIGQSAGAFSVNALVASPLTKGLFAKAIAQSGGMFSADGRTVTLATAENNGAHFAQKLGAHSIQDMRAIPADTLQKLSSSFIASPVIDGYVLPDNVYAIFKDGKQNDVPLLTGWNAQDGFSPTAVPDSATYVANAKRKYGQLANAYLQAFPAGTEEQIRKSLFALNRDNSFAWQAYTWASIQSANGHQKAFVYLFNQTAPGEEKWGAFHSSEIPFALHNLYTWKQEWSAADEKLSDIMSDYWVQFARTGNPNKPTLPKWKPFTTANKEVMWLSADQQAMDTLPVMNEFRFIDRYQQLLRNKK